MGMPLHHTGLELTIYNSGSDHRLASRAIWKGGHRHLPDHAGRGFPSGPRRAAASVSCRPPGTGSSLLQVTPRPPWPYSEGGWEGDGREESHVDDPPTGVGALSPGSSGPPILSLPAPLPPPTGKALPRRGKASLREAGCCSGSLSSAPGHRWEQQGRSDPQPGPDTPPAAPVPMPVPWPRPPPLITSLSPLFPADRGSSPFFEPKIPLAGWRSPWAPFKCVK